MYVTIMYVRMCIYIYTIYMKLNGRPYRLVGRSLPYPQAGSAWKVRGFGSLAFGNVVLSVDLGSPVAPL